jgi:hypothetical protein
MVGTVGLVCVALQAVVSKEVRSNSVVEADVLARAGSYSGRWIMLESLFEMALHSSVVLEVHSSHSL